MSLPDVLAAGGIVWRLMDDHLRVGVVERRRYGGDISLPKGKLDPGERLVDCAVREVAEELGVTAVPTQLAGLMSYRVGERDKYVIFWEMQWVADLPDGLDDTEVADRRWLDPSEALTVLTYERDRRLLADVLSRRSPG
jgi:8-oxo-dGTP diphosphatase